MDSYSILDTRDSIPDTKSDSAPDSGSLDTRYSIPDTKSDSAPKAGSLDTRDSIPDTSKGVFCEVFNVACGQDNSILNLVELLNKIMGKKIEPKLGPTRQGDVLRTLADISKIKRILGYEAQVSFEEGLKKTVEYFINAS